MTNDEIELEEEAIGHLLMFLGMVEDSSGDKLTEAWEADPDAMMLCSSQARQWLENKRLTLRGRP